MATITQRRESEAEPGPAGPPPDAGRLLALAEHAGNMGHWSWDLASGAIALAPPAMNILGQQKAPANVAGFVALFHRQDQRQLQVLLDGAMARQAGFECDLRLTVREGLRTVIVTARPQAGADGRPGAVYGLIADVTEAFAAARALTDRTEMLGLAASLAGLGYWVWSKDQGFAGCSAEMASLYDLTPDEFLLRARAPADLLELVAADDRGPYGAALARALAEGSPYSAEFTVCTPDGNRRDIRETGQPIFEGGRYVRFIAAAQDVTASRRREADLKRTAEELARKTAQLESANHQKDKLFSIIAHDLRAPFNSVIGFADLLAAKSRELSPGKVATYAHMVRDSAVGVHDLLDNLLAWAAYQMRDSALKLQTLNLADVAASSFDPLAHMAEAKGITVANGLGEARAVGDEALVRIVFRNLLSNAIKFSRTGSVVQLRAVAEGPQIRITVRDDGVGIPREVTAALFELGGAVSSPGTGGEKGTGLGLYLCRDIVSRLGGVMSVDSEPGQGAAFHFTLPAVMATSLS